MRNSRIGFLRSTMLTGLLALSALAIQVTPAALAAEHSDAVTATSAANTGATASTVVTNQCSAYASCLSGSRTPDGFEIDAGGPGIRLDRDGDE